jgi:CRP-like cAMP-binding protein
MLSQNYSLYVFDSHSLEQEVSPMPISAKPLRPVENRLLAALPGDVYERILPFLECTSVSLGEVLYETNGRLSFAYFPTTSIVSLVYIMENGAVAEMGLIGNDGLVGLALIMGGETMPNRAIVQHAGGIIRMNGKVLQDEFNLGDSFQHLLLRYTQALITQISQTAVCNRLHLIGCRLARWLLLSHDRVKSDELHMTQEFISNMLGIRREGVTLAACRLQQAGLISYRRGHITILNRAGLEAAACECYRVVKDEFDRLLDY